MKNEDIEGLSAAEIQNKYSLEILPTKKNSLTVKENTTICTGEANPLFKQEGGGIQFDSYGNWFNEEQWGIIEDIS